MKALITAGNNTRHLHPITYTNNKNLIPIGNKPVLFHAINTIKKAGIRDIGITYTGDKSILESSFGNGKDLGVRITYIHQEATIGIADCVRVAEEFIGRDKFILYLGDIVMTRNLKPLVNEFERDRDINCMFVTSQDKHPERFSVPEFDQSGNVFDLTEKPSHPRNNYAVTGIYFYDHHIFKAFSGKSGMRLSERGELEITDATKYLMQQKYTVKAKVVDGGWKDTGRMEDLISANRLVLEKIRNQADASLYRDSELEGAIEVGKNVIIRNSCLRGPISIADGAMIIDSYVGPFTSIGRSCIIKGAEIENSIILDGAQIETSDFRIDASLIGRNAKIIKSIKTARVVSLTLSDLSTIIT